jgi:hypothetical protein
MKKGKSEERRRPATILSTELLVSNSLRGSNSNI